MNNFIHKKCSFPILVILQPQGCSLPKSRTGKGQRTATVDELASKYTLNHPCLQMRDVRFPHQNPRRNIK